MNRVELALRTFFWILFKKEFAQRIEPYFVEQGLAPEKPAEQPVATPVAKAAPAAPKEELHHSDALQVLALFQREGRLVDFLKEPLDPYTDAQVGAAVRDIHRGCGSVMERVFEIRPLIDKQENAPATVPAGFDPQEYRLTGNISGSPPYNGVLRHHGWKANKSELPVWQGPAESIRIIAPAEVELQ